MAALRLVVISVETSNGVCIIIFLWLSIVSKHSQVLVTSLLGYSPFHFENCHLFRRCGILSISGKAYIAMGTLIWCTCM